eukprot:tig00001042_g6596.t1
MSAGLLDLPTELLVQILAELRDLRDINAACETCRALYDAGSSNALWRGMVEAFMSEQRSSSDMRRDLPALFHASLKLPSFWRSLVNLCANATVDQARNNALLLFFTDPSDSVAGVLLSEARLQWCRERALAAPDPRPGHRAVAAIAGELAGRVHPLSDGGLGVRTQILVRRGAAPRADFVEVVLCGAVSTVLERELQRLADEEEEGAVASAPLS